MADLRANFYDADMQAEETLKDEGMERDPIDPSKCGGLMGYWLSPSNGNSHVSEKPHSV